MKVWLSIREAQAEYPFCRTILYEMIGAGKLPAYKAGRKTLLRRADLEALVEHLPRAVITTRRAG